MRVCRGEEAEEVDRSFKSWLLRSICKISQCRLDVSVSDTSNNSFLLRLVVCRDTQSIKWEELHLVCCIFSLLLFFFLKLGENVVPCEREAGDFSAPSVIVSLVLSSFSGSVSI